MISDEKEYYIEAKHWTYTDYTIRARSKEHAIEQFENGCWDNMESDYGWSVSYTHLTLPTILRV